jgi:hypothetical protein
MWKNLVQEDSQQMKIQATRFARCISKATNTKQYQMIIAF